MSISVKIPSLLREITSGRDTIELSAVSSFRQALDEMDKLYPGIRMQLYNKHDQLSPIFEIYVNGVSAYPDELAAPLKDGDEVAISMLYVGG
jgi:molybdopterin converting factor small subunit